MKKKVIKLTEQDLEKLVKKALSEPRPVLVLPSNSRSIKLFTAAALTLSFLPAYLSTPFIKFFLITLPVS